MKSKGTLTEYSLERPMIKDGDWNLVARKFCKVKEFVPMAIMQNGRVLDVSKHLPYASVVFECEGIPYPIKGFISHKIDFKNLWAAFKERPLGENEVVTIEWAKYRLRGFTKLTACALPGFCVMVFNKESIKLLTVTR